MIVYRIRAKDGSFSLGGGYPDFNKTGKIWRGTGPLRNHFGELSDAGVAIYGRAEAVVVQYEMTEVELSSCSYEIYVADSKKRKDEREIKLKG